MKLFSTLLLLTLQPVFIQGQPESAGVSRQTMYNWSKIPEFLAEKRRALLWRERVLGYKDLVS